MRTKTWAGALTAAFLIAVLLGLGVYAYENIIVSQEEAIGAEEKTMLEIGAPASLTAFKVERPNFVVEGSGLERVEVWGVPEGGPGDSHELFGDATLRSQSAAGAQVWTLPIPVTPVAVREIYAKAFNANGDPIAQMPLQLGPGAGLRDAVWGKAERAPSATPALQEAQRRFSFTLAPGQRRTIGALSMKLVAITADSRCPQSAVCIWAGEVETAVELSLGSRTQTVELRSGGPAYTFGNYRIAIAGVFPARRTEAPISKDAYRIEFTVERL